MKKLAKIIGILGLVTWITCLVMLKQEFGTTAWFMGLGCGIGMGFARLLDQWRLYDLQRTKRSLEIN